MACINEVFPVILYFLGSILLIALIVLVIKAIKTLSKVNKFVAEIDDKQKKLNGVFDIIDNTADALSIFSDKLVIMITTAIKGLFSKKSKKEEEENE